MSRRHLPLSVEEALYMVRPEGPTPPPPIICTGFKTMFDAHLTLHFGHVRQPGGYLTLVVLYQMTGQEAQTWRNVDVPYSSAFDGACTLVKDARDWAYDLGARVERSAEDLGPDDFIEHVRLTVEGGFQ